uniref:Uncharacterized protein LOC105035952 n=1 Tax=Elaeis guineensis var. tenera TaxID=51953 RepID=A0A6I9QI62_ELAGV|nr:uncharacterized protein LOC105035952 [Elaeis guineensis]
MARRGREKFWREGGREEGNGKKERGELDTLQLELQEIAPEAEVDVETEPQKKSQNGSNLASEFSFFDKRRPLILLGLRIFSTTARSGLMTLEADKDGIFHFKREIKRWDFGGGAPSGEEEKVLLRASGATSGIGKETARVLALRGATVVIPCRTLKSGRKVKESTLEQNPDANIDILEMDLSSLDSVEPFGPRF